MYIIIILIYIILIKRVIKDNVNKFYLFFKNYITNFKFIIQLYI